MWPTPISRWSRAIRENVFLHASRWVWRSPPRNACWLLWKLKRTWSTRPDGKWLWNTDRWDDFIFAWGADSFHNISQLVLVSVRRDSDWTMRSTILHSSVRDIRSLQDIPFVLNESVSPPRCLHSRIPDPVCATGDGRATTDRRDGRDTRQRCAVRNVVCKPRAGF